jgi:RNA polymerase sigma factor (sigma-70 family)
MKPNNEKNPRCTVEEDLALLKRYQNDDLQALAELCDCHFGLIGFWVGKLSSTVHWVDREDLMQEACIGFIKAAKKFDTSRNKFHAYARYWVLGAIYQSREVRLVKRTLYRNRKHVMEMQEELMRELDRKPTLEELSEKTQLSVEQVDNALNAIVPFSFPLEETDRWQEIADPAEFEFTDTLEDSEGRLEPFSPEIEDAINKLSSDDAEVIVRFYFRRQTDSKIGEDLGKSKNAITMRRTRAVEKLREILGKGVQRDGTRGH